MDTPSLHPAVTTVSLAGGGYPHPWCPWLGELSSWGKPVTLKSRPPQAQLCHNRGSPGAPRLLGSSVPLGLPFIAGCGSRSLSDWGQRPGLRLSHAVRPSIRPCAGPPWAVSSHTSPAQWLTSLPSAVTPDGNQGWEDRGREGWRDVCLSALEGGGSTGTGCSRKVAPLGSPSIPSHRPTGETEARGQGWGAPCRSLRCKLPPSPSPGCFKAE